MVKALHRAGIEVILDVVYNHTAEGNHLGPMLSFRGVDNQSYYRLVPDNPRYYMDYTGTGNTLNPRASDGAAADHGLAAVLRARVPRRRLPLRPRLGARARVLRGRPPLGVLRHHPPGPDPVPGEADRRAVGRRPGRLPGRELPDPLVGVERHLPRHDARLLARATAPLRDFASRFGGSADLYENDGRRPFASINFITAHDGFTLRDLVSYNDKHNEANGEDNRDGTDDNRSWNCGVEGPTDDPAMLALRARQQRNFLATLFLSQGVPMLLGGDEIGRTQGGNNNAWCQDNEISWFDWDACDADLLAFTRRLIELRRAHPVFRRTQFFEGTGRAAAGRLVDAPGRPPDDAARLGQHRVARDRRLPERRRARAPRRRTARRCATTRSSCSSTRTSRTSRSACRRGGSARAGSVVLTTGRARRSGFVPGRGRGGRDALARGAASCRDAASLFRATYRLQLTPDFGFAAGARARAVPARARHLASLPLAVASGARRARSTATTSSTRATISDALGGEDEFRELADAGLGVILDIVPNHMAAVDENPFWRDLRAARRCSSTSTCAPGFHRRFFDVGELGGLKQEDWEVFWATHAKVIELVREGVVDGVRVDHPDGLADPGRVLRAARRGRRRARLGGEDRRAGRGAARLADRGDDGLRVPERRDGAAASTATPSERSPSSTSD